MRILLTRPEAPALSLKEKLEALGHQVALSPLLSIVPAEFSIDQAGLGGIVMTSASAAPALTSAALPRHIAIYAIGGTSAEAARGQGFDNVISADGKRASLVDLIASRHDPASGHLLHLAGSHRAGDIVAELNAQGIETKRVRVYEAVAATGLPAHISDLIGADKIEGVLFFSPRSAAIFVSLAEDSGLGDALSGMTAICLSDAVAKSAEAGNWKGLHLAEALTEDAMIEALEVISRNGD